MSLDLTAFNANWLRAWSDKDVPRLLDFYTDDVAYTDQQTAQGIKGRPALEAYLTGLFAAVPPMVYTADDLWPTPNGYCGRWYCEIGDRGAAGRLRGFDLVILRGERIAVNEVYVHQLPPA